MGKLNAKAAVRGRLIAVGLAVSAAGLIVAACSTVPGDTADAGEKASPRRCLSAPLDTTRVLDGKTLFVEDRSGTAALLHMNASCLGSDFDPVGFTFRGSSQICHPIDAEIKGQINTVAIPCFVKSIEILDKERAKELRFGAKKDNSW
ncbi:MULTISPECIES: DUF6491 family protein [Asticcacaulis]|uniref:DUF6491 family protein n=1 Tax=Asticcacaulis TaxID=76890 RepID=UPI001AEADF8E|nr:MULTISPECIES: DUF6491 family protein [Asticcacaulis]MBP2158564.1 hypothetical protein [Asticcacaulis solisilvae]MDR6799610.1 hypothetical protein [Asticcacaulis sp. BE141]